MSKEWREKLGKSHIGKLCNEKHPLWKGENVSYRCLHMWVHRKLGKPMLCEFCGKEKTTVKSIHWANKSHNYLRNLTDWISLCVHCHKAYDRKQLKTF